VPDPGLQQGTVGGDSDLADALCVPDKMRLAAGQVGGDLFLPLAQVALFCQSVPVRRVCTIEPVRQRREGIGDRGRLDEQTIAPGGQTLPFFLRLRGGQLKGQVRVPLARFLGLLPGRLCCRNRRSPRGTSGRLLPRVRSSACRSRRPPSPGPGPWPLRG